MRYEIVSPAGVRIEKEIKFRQLESFFLIFDLANSLKLFEQSLRRVSIDFGKQQKALSRPDSVNHGLFEEVLACKPNRFGLWDTSIKLLFCIQRLSGQL